MNNNKYSKALELAMKYHEGQKRLKSGLDYIIHPIAVADKFNDEDHKIVAVLHDIVEDTEMTIEELIGLGFRGNVVMSIDLLTKKKDQNYLQYLMRLKKNEVAREVKIEDIKHNLSDLEKGNMKDKYLLALYILLEQ